jgi:hypothetical protein
MKHQVTHKDRNEQPSEIGEATQISTMGNYSHVLGLKEQ